MAIIADAGGREKVYRIGDQIRAGVTLAEVFRNGVVVAHGDLRQRLPLTGRTSAENPPPGNSQAISLRAELPAAATPEADGVTTVPRHRSNFSPEVRRQSVIVPDPGGGFQLKKVMRNSLYARIGLRTGDVLRSVNGQPIDSPEQLMLLYQQLSEGGRGTVELLREGRPEALQFGGS
jgi:general secretion pathway protein C